jgi:3-hydroxyisobutyrate dehydrogenase-like beta-hydroxyacid dehydrogenase
VTEGLSIAVLGLGEAGRIFATDFGAHPAGAVVTGFDPFWNGTADGYTVAASAAEAVANAEVIIALTAAPDALPLFDSVAEAIPSGAVYADFSSSSPELKVAIAARAETLGVPFVDAVLLAPVPAARIATPVQAAGSGATLLAERLGPLGMNIDPISATAGEAAARKLLRSIVVKGLTALLIESLRAAEDQQLLEWFSGHVTDTLTTLTPAFLTRLVEGTLTHSARRVHEMMAAVEMVEAGGGDPVMTRATVEVIRSAADLGIPRGAALGGSAANENPADRGPEAA